MKKMLVSLLAFAVLLNGCTGIHKSKDASKIKESVRPVELKTYAYIEHGLSKGPPLIKTPIKIDNYKKFVSLYRAYLFRGNTSEGTAVYDTTPEEYYDETYFKNHVVYAVMNVEPTMDTIIKAQSAVLDGSKLTFTIASFGEGSLDSVGYYLCLFGVEKDKISKVKKVELKKVKKAYTDLKGMDGVFHKSASIKTNTSDTEKIAEQLLVAFFNEYKQDTILTKLRLADYRIDEITIFNKQPYHFDVTVRYSVKPYDMNSYHPPIGSIIEDSWVKNIVASAGVQKSGMTEGSCTIIWTKSELTELP